MRISTTQLFQSGISAMQRSQVALDHTNQQLATGRRILTPADDPSGATQSLQLDAAINATKQFQRNGDYVQPKLEQEESQLDAYENYMQRARELVVTGNSDTYNQADRKYLAKEIRELRDGILGIANSKDANGEYLFAGTRSFDEPFGPKVGGGIAYVGADGQGAVREVAITTTRSIAVGDTGKSVFVDIPEKSGQVVDAVLGVANTGTLVVQASQVTDKETFTLTPKEVYKIQFSADTDSDGNLEYSVVDSTGAFAKDDTGADITNVNFTSGSTIQFAGRSVTLNGTPAAGDTVTLRPAPTISIFDTLDAIATALETPATDGETRQALRDATSTALLNIDSSLERMNQVRTTVGTRLQTLDTQTNLNDEQLLNLKSALSDVRDLDYAEAISRYKQQETVLQAAQQTYAQVTKLSLFNFL
jgi:flagellar hook-associated protein 3 FlgL